MQNLTDFLPGDVVEFKFNTRDTNQAAITLAGTPSVAVYKDHGTTEDTSGVTLVVDFDSKTGLHAVYIDTSSDTTFYSIGGQFSVVLAAGTIDGISHVGVQLASFSIARSIDAFGIKIGVLAGTHSSTTADLGVNAPTTDISGATLNFPSHNISRVVDSYNTGTGVATFSSVPVTLANDDRWVLFATAPLEGGTAPTVEEIRTEMDSNSTQLAKLGTPAGASISADIAAKATQVSVDDLPTNAELATALGTADDAVLSAIAAVSTKVDAVDDLLDTELPALTTAVADLPTNAELATALGTADDAVLSAIAAVSTKVDTVDDLLDTELPALTAAVADLPTNAELATALGTADDAVLSAIAALNNLSNAQLTTAIAAGDDATLAAIAALNNLSSAQVSTLLASADDATLAAITALNNISVADILAATIEGSTTLLQSLRLHNAVLAGKASGLATTTAVYRDLADSKNRVSATVDAFGNRTAVTRDVS